LTACTAVTMATGTGVFEPEAAITVSSATKSAAAADFATVLDEPRRRAIASHPRPYATTSSPATSITGDHALADTCPQPSTITAPETTPAAWSSAASIASHDALRASVSTNSAANNGHGGVDHRG